MDEPLPSRAWMAYDGCMRTHPDIDERSLQLARAIVAKLEAQGVDAGLARATEINRSWREISPSPLHDAWAGLLSKGWPTVRKVLLDESERGTELRQNNPFCGVLTPQERWRFFRPETRHDT